MLRWATSNAGAGLGRVIAVTHPGNGASKRVLEKIGMRLVGETDAFYDAVTTLYETRPDGGSSTACQP